MRTAHGLIKSEKGATVVYAALILTFLIMITALGVDVGHLYAVRNELQDAADAGALAGASVLLNEDTGDLQVAEVNDEADRVVNLNQSGSVQVAVRSIEIGHWSFSSPERTFTSGGENPVQMEGWKEIPASVLDGRPAFINAVKVVTERAAPSFLARIFNIDSFLVRTEAVAYIGFAGPFEPGEFDQPIAICFQSIDNGEGGLDCNAGRMINSGNDPSSSNTAAWTNFSQPCGTANPPTVRPLVCSAGNPTDLFPEQGMGTTNGMVDNIFRDLYRCWEDATEKERNWPLLLPVIDCPTTAISPCAILKSGVSLNVIWMTDQISQGPNEYIDAPRLMNIYDGDGNVVDTWSNDNVDGFTRWKDFVMKFSLKNADGRPFDETDTEGFESLYQQSSIFFQPNCEFAKPTGGTGGVNTGVQSDRPVLVL